MFPLLFFVPYTTFQSYLHFMFIWFTNCITCLTYSWRSSRYGGVRWWCQWWFIWRKSVWIRIRKRELKLDQYNQICRNSANNLENITLQQWNVNTQIPNVPRTNTRRISRASKYKIVNSRSHSMKQYIRSVFPKLFLCPRTPFGF